MTDFDQLYRDYFRDVFLYVRRLSGGNERLAEDVTSEAFFRAMKSVDSFRGDCDVRVWLCQIAKNCYYTHLKQSRRATPVEAAEQLALAQEGESPEEFLLRGERARQIQRLLHELPDPYKEILLWRVLGDMSFRQIGALFHRTENWACVTYHRARSMIRKRMEADDDEA